MLIKTEPKTFHFKFDFLKYVSKNPKDKTEFTIKHNESGYEIKNEIRQLLSKCKHGNDIHEHHKQQNGWATEFVLNLSQRLDLRSSNKHVALQNLSIYYT